MGTRGVSPTSRPWSSRARHWQPGRRAAPLLPALHSAAQQSRRAQAPQHRAPQHRAAQHRLHARASLTNGTAVHQTRCFLCCSLQELPRAALSVAWAAPEGQASISGPVSWASLRATLLCAQHGHTGRSQAEGQREDTSLEGRQGTDRGNGLSAPGTDGLRQ